MADNMFGDYLRHMKVTEDSFTAGGKTALATATTNLTPVSI
jgi:hypothetical protein